MDAVKAYLEILDEVEKKDVRLIAVTKKRSVSEINSVIESGCKDIGESQIQEFLAKKEGLLPCKRYFIGHLQSNKVRGVVENFDVIESVDSLKLAKKIDEVARDLGKVQEVYLQINISEEESKYGLGYGDVLDFYSKLLKFVNIKVTGLMCIAPYGEDPRPYFKKMRELFSKLPVKELSMGMSSDYRTAIEQGATEIRIGRGIFGER